MPTTIASSEVRSLIFMRAKVTYGQASDQSCLRRLWLSAWLKDLSDDSYIALRTLCVAYYRCSNAGEKTMAKIQGEGDYVSARRYNSETRKFVKAKGAAASRKAN